MEVIQLVKTQQYNSFLNTIHRTGSYGAVLGKVQVRNTAYRHDGDFSPLLNSQPRGTIYSFKRFNGVFRFTDTRSTKRAAKNLAVVLSITS